MTAVQSKPETILDFINNGDSERLASFFYGSMAKTGGSILVAPDGSDWDDPIKREVLQPRNDSEPAGIDEALRWCVVVDDIPECDPATAAIVYLDRATGGVKVEPLSGPARDYVIATEMVARKLQLVKANDHLPQRPKWADRVRKRRSKITVEVDAPPTPTRATPKAANDNKPAGKVYNTIDAESLLGLEFEPIRYVVPGYIAEGLTLLGGRPKLGKSWLALDFGIAVATGGQSLGVQCQAGDALYLALEDNQRRLQDRLRLVLPAIGRPDLSRLSLLTEAPKIGSGLIEMLNEWRCMVPDARLIIVDTLAIVRPPKGKNQDSYAADYDALSPLQRFASEHRIAVVVVTHVRKAEADDPLEMISGTNGLTGAADSIMILNRTADGPKLYGRGRDVEEIEKALQFDGGRWSALGDVDEVRRSKQRRMILSALLDATAAMSPDEIAKASGLKVGNVNVLLRKMVTDGEVKKLGYGAYVHPSKTDRTGESPVEV